MLIISCYYQKVYFPTSSILLMLVEQVYMLYIGIARMKHKIFHVQSHIIIYYAIQIYPLKSFSLFMFFTFLVSVRTFNLEISFQSRLILRIISRYLSN